MITMVRLSYHKFLPPSNVSFLALFLGGKDFEKATAWLNKKFTSVNKNPDKPIYVHVTCATDTSNIKFTFNAVEELILYETLAGNGLV